MTTLIESTDTHCEEANLYGMVDKTGQPFPCGKPATKRMECVKDGRIYHMCDWCADTNLRRGMKDIGEVKYG